MKLLTNYHRKAAFQKLTWFIVPPSCIVNCLATDLARLVE
jgi:hypothetical protein